MVRLLLGQVIDGPLIVYVAFSLKNGQCLRLFDCAFEFGLIFSRVHNKWFYKIEWYFGVDVISSIWFEECEKNNSKRD